MQKITLYKYTRSDGGITVSPVKPECEYTMLYRLVADEGNILSSGKEETACVDTETPEEWSEIENGDQNISGDEFISMVEEVL